LLSFRYKLRFLPLLSSLPWISDAHLTNPGKCILSRGFFYLGGSKKMKRHIPYILSLLFLITSLLGPSSYAGARGLAVSNGTPGMVSYQGQVSVDGHPFSGTGYFKFAIIDPVGATSYWSNDGTSTAGGQPTHAETLPVANGLFNVLLGDAGLGMPPLTPDVFSAPNRMLRVWFSQNGSTFTLLAPDSPIASVPYALQAQQAVDSASLNGHPADDFLNTIHYLGRFYTSQVDTAGDVGESSSVTIGSDGLGLISYTYNTGIDLRVLHCGNLMCNSGNTITSVDTAGLSGEFSSIAVGADGLGLVSYYDLTNGHLKVLHCGDILCSSGNIGTTVDTASDVGPFSSITIGIDGLGLISYYDGVHGYLKVLHCGNLLCSSGNTSASLDTSITIDGATSITIGSDGLGLISYYDDTNKNLKVLHCGNLLCNSGNTNTSVDTAGETGWYPSITIGADGLGLISYSDVTNEDLKVLHCGNLLCNSGNTSASVDTAGSVGWASSITIGVDGLGLIVYADNTNHIVKLLHCGNVECNNGNTIGIVNSNAGDFAGAYNSITIGADGLALISFLGGTTDGDLWVAKVAGLGRR
jgi:hypothetical protein